MSAENWLKRASGLVVPAMGFANLAGKMQPCPDGECCEQAIDCGACNEDELPTPLNIKATLAGGYAASEGFDGDYILPQLAASPGFPAPCAWAFFDPAVALFLNVSFENFAPDPFEWFFQIIYDPPGGGQEDNFTTAFQVVDEPAGCGGWSDTTMIDLTPGFNPDIEMSAVPV